MSRVYTGILRACIADNVKHIVNPFVRGSNELGFGRLFENDLLETIPQLRLNSFLYRWLFIYYYTSMYNHFAIVSISAVVIIILYTSLKSSVYIMQSLG